jgi:hypothetical protein
VVCGQPRSEELVAMTIGDENFTPLVKGNRFADRYLETLANAGKLVSRTMGDHQLVFDQLGMPIKYDINGNMASIYYDA